MNLWVEFGRKQWTGVKGILEWVGLGCSWLSEGDRSSFGWWKGWLLGELGGVIGRGSEAEKGGGLLEKKEGVLLNSEGGIGERIAGGRPWNWALSLRDAQAHSQALSLGLFSLGIGG